MKSDGVPIEVVIVTRGGETKTVSYGATLNDPPIEMVIISSYIEIITSNATWEKVGDEISPA